jgi:hypothetical protein
MDKLYDWTRNWGMQFNIEKCKIMHFSHRNPGYSYDGIDNLEPEKIFKRMTRQGIRTRANADPLNIEKGQARTQIRQNFTHYE